MSLDLSALRRILIVKPSSLGDIVHTLPLLACLRRGAPRAEIRWLVNSAWDPLLRNHPLLDGLVEFPRDRFRGGRAVGEFLRWRRELDWRPDLALDVQGLLRSAILARMTRAERIVGYSDAREGAHFLHHEVVDVSRKRSPHAVDRYLTVLEALGLDWPDQVEFPLPPGEKPAGAGELPENFVVLHPYSRGKGKSLRSQQVEAMAQDLRLPVVVVGRAGDAALDLRECDRNWLNRTTLPELIWILRQAAWVVSVDSGPMHLAAALTPRLLAIHTWSDPAKVGPYAPEAWIWKAGQIFQTRDRRAAGDGGEFSGTGVGDIVEFVNREVERRGRG